MSDLTLEQLDQDGAIRETIDRVYGDSRANFLRKAVIGSGTLLVALGAPSSAAARANETNILNYGLAFEYLQATFYTEAERLGTIARMRHRKAVWARTLGAHERAHVAILKSVLGKRAIRKPSFDFGGNTEDIDQFTRTAVAMEDLTVALLVGQAPRFHTRNLVAAIFSLLTVEARHAAWARRIVGTQPVAAAFDQPKTLAQVDSLVASTRFISTLQPKVLAKRKPQFTG